MASALPLRAALERGALLTVANWPILVIEFAIESLFKFALAVPIVGGAFMVAVLVGADVGSLFDEGLQAAGNRVVASLDTAPVALASFLLAVLIVACGGALLMFGLKAGTLTVLAAGERAAPDLRRGPLKIDWFRQAHAYDAPTLLAGVKRFGRRAAILGVWLGVAYLLTALAYVMLLRLALRLSPGEPGGFAFWPLVIALATSAGLVAVVAINLAYDLLRVIVVVDDCRLRDAARKMRAFVMKDARQVIGILGVMGAVVILATALALLVTAGLAFVGYVPVVGLIFLPLQAAAWLVRGLVFQHVSLMTIAAYQTQYRRYAEPSEPGARPATHLWVQRA
jgi:hypothetical protein